MACSGLGEVLAERLRPEVRESLDVDFRTARLEQNLVGCMTVRQMTQATLDLSKGDGGELGWGKDGSRPSAHSVCSSATLAVNSFACWIGSEANLELAGQSKFSELIFERKFPVWPKRRAPNLDVTLVYDGGVVAVESKFTEPCSTKTAKFKPVYSKATQQMHPSWSDLFHDLLKEKDRGPKRHFKRLDAAQLVKHYLGLKTAFPDGGATLLYLCWEPQNGDSLDWVTTHRKEIEHFAGSVNDPDLPFEFLTYDALWTQWASVGEPWLTEHVAELRQRYDVNG